MRIRLQASKESPLLFLMLPLAAGTYIGLCYHIGIYSQRNILLYTTLIGFLGLLFLQKRIANSPFSQNLQKLFLGLTAFLFFNLSILWSSHAMQGLNPIPANGYIQLHGVIIEKPTEKPKTYAIVFQPENHTQKILLYISKDDDSKRLKTGTFLQIKTKLQLPENLSKNFDYITYLKTRGITQTGFVSRENWKRCTPFKLPKLTFIRMKAMQLRDQLEQRIDTSLSDGDTRALVHAMLLGDKSTLTVEQKDAYSATGLSHLLALSGMHISFITLLFGWIFYWCPPKVKNTLMITGTWGFILLVGLPISAVRAGFMLTLLILTPFSSERTMAMDRWALTAIILLIIKPINLFDIGFQLSFAAVGGIFLFMPLYKKISFIPNTIQKTIQTCLSAQLAVLPLSLYHFGTFPIYFLLTNLLICLFFTPLTIYLSIGILIIGKETILTAILIKIMKIQEFIISIVQHLPGAQLSIPNFRTGSLLISYILIAILLNYLIKKDSKSIIQLEICMICLLILYNIGL